jgi:DNA primase
MLNSLGGLDARPLTQHLFHVVLPEGAAASFEAKMAALQRLRPIAEPLPVGLVRATFFARLWLPAQVLELALSGKPISS